MANLDGSCKKVTGPVQCEDFARVIVAMYEKGDRSVLDTLLGAGKWSDGALSEMLGQFYADRLSKEADLFLSKLAERSQDEQENLCGLAVAADGGGSGDDWGRAVRATLESILVSRGRDGLKKPALACLDQLKKFQEQKLNQP